MTRVLQEYHSNGTEDCQKTLAPALASERNIEVEKIAIRCNAFICGSITIPKREDKVQKLQSTGSYILLAPTLTIEREENMMLKPDKMIGEYH
jgi:hypothetical protein